MADKAGRWSKARSWFRRLRSRTNYQKEAEGFEAWCKEVRSVPVADTLSLEDVRKMHDDHVRQRFQEWAAKSTHSFSFHFPIHHQDLLSSLRADFAVITVEGDGQTALSIRGSTFRSLTLNNVGTIVLENCRIGRFEASGANPNYLIKNCMIGEFDVPGNSRIHRMVWDGGYLGRFNLHGDREKLFDGEVWLHNLALSKNPEHHGVQWLRDARTALNARSNFVAAGVFHASELALSRKREPFINRVASYVYQVGSNFGNSLGWPIFWFAGSLLAIAGLALLVGTVANVEPKSGWQTALTGEGCVAQVLRAGIYAMQSIFNPLNLIVQKPLVSVGHWGAALASFVLGLFGLVAFALFLLSLRRRFKLD
jgi:hypothetical protein